MKAWFAHAVSAQAHCEARLGVTVRCSFALMIARSVKLDVRPTFERQLQIHPRTRQIYQLAIMIKRQVIECANAVRSETGPK